MPRPRVQVTAALLFDVAVLPATWCTQYLAGVLGIEVGALLGRQQARSLLLVHTMVATAAARVATEAGVSPHLIRPQTRRSP